MKYISLSKHWNCYEVLTNPSLYTLYYGLASPRQVHSVFDNFHVMPPRAVIAEKPGLQTNHQVTYIGRFDVSKYPKCNVASVKETDNNGTLSIFFGMTEVKYLKYVNVLFVLNTKAPNGNSVNPIYQYKNKKN